MNWVFYLHEHTHDDIFPMVRAEIWHEKWSHGQNSLLCAREDSVGILSMYMNTFRGAWEEDSVRLFPVASSGKTRSKWGLPSIGTGFPEWWCSLHLWRSSKTNWTLSWTTGCRCFCLNRGLDQVTFRAPFQAQPLCDSEQLFPMGNGGIIH